jgi:hypothetical protein
MNLTLAQAKLAQHTEALGSGFNPQ